MFKESVPIIKTITVISLPCKIIPIYCGPTAGPTPASDEGKFTSLRTAPSSFAQRSLKLEAKVSKKQANVKWVLLRPVVLNSSQKVTS